MLVGTPIKRKLVTVIMVTSLIVLLLTIVAFMVYDLVTFRRTMAQNLTTLAQMIADNSNAAMQFQDKRVSQEILNSLKSDPHIITAALYDKDGKLLVRYPLDIKELPAVPGNLGSYFTRSHLTIFQPIWFSGARLGTLYLNSDTRALTDRLKPYGFISLMKN